MSVTKNFRECESVRVNLVALTDGELDPARADIVREHLMGCDSCVNAHSDIVALLEMTKHAISVGQLADHASRDIDFPRTAISAPETATLLSEIRSLRDEVKTLRAEMVEMRKLLIAVRGRIADIPARPITRPAYPYSPAIDRLRTDR